MKTSTVPSDDELKAMFEEAAEETETDTLEPIQVNRPVLQFQVLHSLSQLGVYFVDIDTGNPIDGCLDLPAIGVTLTPPTTIPPRTPLGFLHLQQNKLDPNDSANTFEIDGILYFEYKGKECETGYLPEEGALLFFLKIWNDVDMHLWLEIINKVILSTSINQDGQLHPLVYFIISSAYVPNNTLEPSRLVLKRKNCDIETADGVSSFSVTASEDFCDDETNRFTPIF